MRAKFRDAVLDRRGHGIEATIEVREPGTTTPVAAALYDEAGNVLANPITANTAGEFEFYMDDAQRVDLFVSKDTFTAETQQVDVLGPDPAPVQSVFGRTGDVVPQLADYNGFFLTPAEGDAAYDPFGAAASALSTAESYIDTSVANYVPLSQKGAASGVATLDSGSKIPITQLPALAITSTSVVASQAAMLALTAQEGDVAIRSDEKKTYILSTSDPTQLANWLWLQTPDDAVSSFNGRVGAVMPLQADYDGFFLTPAEGDAAYLAKGALTDGSVLFAASGQVQQNNAHLFWDDAKNRLGIGTAAPLVRLHVSDGASVASALLTTDAISLTDQSGNLTTASLISVTDVAGTRGVVKGVRARGTLSAPTVPNTDDEVFAFLGSIYDGATTQGTAGVFFRVDGAVSAGVAPQRISFVTSATTAAARTEKVTIKSDGKVGIGITEPTSMLHVADSSSSSPRGITSGQYNTGPDGARLHTRKARGTYTTPLSVAAGDTLGRWVADGYDGTNYLDMGAIAFESEGTVASTRIPTRLVFLTATNAAPSVLTEAMRITSDQWVGIGTTAPLRRLAVADASANTMVVLRSVASGAATNGLTIGRIYFGTNSTSAPGAVLETASILGVATEAWTVGTAQGSGVRIQGTQNGTTSTISVLESSGRQYLWIDPDANSTSSAQGIAFGTSRDTQIYRSGVGIVLLNNSLGIGQSRQRLAALSVLPLATPNGGSTALASGGVITAQTVTYGTTAQTGDVSAFLIEQQTYASTPASTVIPDLSGLRIKGPVTSGANASATRTQALLIETGADANNGVVIRQNSGTQSAPLILFQNSSAGTIATIGGDGKFTSKDGTATTPGHAFISETTLGTYRISAGILGFTANAELARMSASLFQLAAGVMLTLNQDTSAAQTIVAGTTNGLKIGTATNQKLGFFNAAPVIQPVRAATLTNNVTVGGTDDRIDDITAASVDTTAAKLTDTRNAIYQLARAIRAHDVGLRALGLLS
jgi:hypothetical protein